MTHDVRRRSSRPANAARNDACADPWNRHYRITGLAGGRAFSDIRSPGPVVTRSCNSRKFFWPPRSISGHDSPAGPRPVASRPQFSRIEVVQLILADVSAAEWRQKVAGGVNPGKARNNPLLQPQGATGAGWDQASQSPRGVENTWRAAGPPGCGFHCAARIREMRVRFFSSTVDVSLWWAGGSAHESARPSRIARLVPPYNNRVEQVWVWNRLSAGTPRGYAQRASRTRLASFSRPRGREAAERGI